MNSLHWLRSLHFKQTAARQAGRALSSHSRRLRSGGVSLRLETLEDRLAPATISISEASATEGPDVARMLDIPMTAATSPLDGPGSIAIGPNGDYFVASRQSHSVLRYDHSTFAFLGVFIGPGSGGLDLPIDLVFADGRVFVSDATSGAVLQYDGVTGASLGTFIPAGAHQIGRPTDLLVRNGELYVGAWSGDVHRYNITSGQFIDKFVQPGAGGLDDPVGIQFGPDGNFYVADYSPIGAKAVLRYNGTTGAFIDQFVPANSGGLDRPAGIKFGPDGNLYVVDRQQDNVLRYRGDTGAFIDTFILGSQHGIDFPARLLFLGNQLFVNSETNDKIMRFEDSSWTVFNVTLSNPATSNVTVQYSTAPGTAAAGSDFTSASGTLTFAPGESSKTILVKTIDDSGLEPVESFVVNLSNPVGATIADGQGTGTILDNDGVPNPSGPTVSISDATATEGDQLVHYRGRFVDGFVGSTISFGPQGLLYTGTNTETGTSSNAVERYNATTGEFVDEFVPEGRIDGVRDILFRDGKMYVASINTNEVLRYDLSTGSFVDAFVTAGSGGIVSPEGMLFGPDANGDGIPELYVTGWNSHNVVRYDGVTGQPLGSFVASSSGGLRFPFALSIGPGAEWQFPWPEVAAGD